MPAYNIYLLERFYICLRSIHVNEGFTDQSGPNDKCFYFYLEICTEGAMMTLMMTIINFIAIFFSVGM